MPYAMKDDAGAWAEVPGGFTGADDVAYPAGWFDDPSRSPAEHAAELARLGAAEIVEATTAPPANVKSATLTLADVGGVPKRVWDVARYSVEEARAIAWERAKAVREEHANGGCDSPLGRTQTDADSRLKINGAVTMAMLAKQEAQPFSMPWTMADNSVVPHNADQMIQLGVAVGLHYAACYANALVLRAAIDAAGTVTAAFAVDVTAGYPA